MRRSWVLAGCMLVVVMTACDPPAGPSSLASITSQFGFTIRASQGYTDAGGMVTQAHADMADQAWHALMTELLAAGFAEADSERRTYATVWLLQPIGDDELIEGSCSGDLTGGCYRCSGNGRIEVPGNYPTSTYSKRPWSQGLKHEFTHHWCNNRFGHMCTTSGVHQWAMPNGKNIWDLQWQ